MGLHLIRLNTTTQPTEDVELHTVPPRQNGKEKFSSSSTRKKILVGLLVPFLVAKNNSGISCSVLGGGKILVQKDTPFLRNEKIGGMALQLVFLLLPEGAVIGLCGLCSPRVSPCGPLIQPDGT